MTAGAPTLSTFLFADLAGYTALTEAHGDDEAANLAGAFCDAVRDLLPEYDAEGVKVIGDEVMVRGRNAAKAVRLALRIAHEVGARHGFPAVRIGMHTGPAVERRGDWFGATVNAAARVSSYAALRSGGHDTAHLPVDPVCRMAVDPRHCAGTLVHDGAEYHFCSLRCVRAFAEHPDRYALDVDR